MKKNRMKQWLCGVLLLCGVLFLEGQNSIDSLEQIWYDESQEDTVRILAVEQLCREQYMYTQPDSAIYWAEQAYDFAEEKNIKKAMSSALRSMGVVAKNSGDLEKAIVFFRKSLRIEEELGNQSGILRTASSMANAYARKHDFANSVNYDLRCLKIAEQLGNDFYMTGMLNNIGTTYIDLKDYENALNYFNRALEIHKDSKQEKCLALEGITMYNLGNVFNIQKDYQKALEHFQKALILNKKYNKKNGIAFNHFGLGELYFQLENIEQAKYHLTKSLALHQKSNDTKAISNCLTYFGRIYQYTNPDSSFILTKQALRMAQESEAIEEVSKAAAVLSQLYETKGNYQQALVMHKLFRDMRDSVSSETNRNAVLRSEYQYEYDKKILEDEVKYEQQVREQQLRVQLERFLLFGGMALFSLFIGSYIKSRYERSLVERKRLLSEIEFLKERLATQTVATSPKKKELGLDKSKIEAKIEAKLGESSWMILNTIFQDPSISNKKIAEQVNLSLEGVSSSLRRMYITFDIGAAANKKIALLTKAVRLSLDN